LRVLFALLVVVAVVASSPWALAQETSDKPLASPVPATATAVPVPLASPTPTSSPESSTVSRPDCQDVWQDESAARTRMLLADCVTRRPIPVPNGWTLDGGGHTIFAVDSYESAYGDGIVTIRGGRGVVRDLTIDGAGTAFCAPGGGRNTLVGIMVINGTGEVTGVTVQNLSWPPSVDEANAGTWEGCGTGIVALGNPASVLVEESVVRNVGYAGIVANEGDASVARTTIEHADTGIVATYGAGMRVAAGTRISDGATGIRFTHAGTSGRIAGTTIERMSLTGIDIWFDARASIAGNTIADAGETGIVVARARTRATLADNNITGGMVGISVSEGATADLSGNFIDQTATAGIAIGSGARATLAMDTLAQPGQDGIQVDGPGSSAIVTDTAVSGALESGIRVQGGAQAVIGAGNRVEGGQWGVVVIDPGSTALVNGNTVADASNQGIVVSAGAAATVAENTITGGETAILVQGPGSALIENNTISNPANIGIALERGADGTPDEPGASGAANIVVRACETDQASRPLIIPAGAEVRFGIPYRAEALPHRLTIDALGIDVELRPGDVSDPLLATSAGTYEYACTRLGEVEPVLTGTVIATGSAPAGDALRGNTIDGGQYGISVVGAGPMANIEDNHVADAARDGISLAAGASATLRGNRITDAASSGIYIDGAATATVGEGNEVSGGQWGIAIFGPGTTATVSGNTFSALRYIGISILDGASATIAGNTVSDVESGMSVSGQDSQAMITGNRVSNMNLGMEILEGATVEIAGNGLTGARRIGIVTGPGTAVEIRDNTITGGTALPGEGGPHGIDVYPDVTGTITANAISGHVNPDPVAIACGIVLADPPSPVSIAGNLFPEPGNEVDVCPPYPATPVAF
jgi:nitrous oxidase accessory protein NosD